MAKKINDRQFARQLSDSKYEVLDAQEQYYRDVWVVISYMVDLDSYNQDDLIKVSGLDNLENVKSQYGEDFDMVLACAIADNDSSLKHRAMFSGTHEWAIKICEKR